MELPITHTGPAHVFAPGSPLSFNNVLVVHDIKKNLLYVSQLTSDYPCYFHFDDRGLLLRIDGHTRCWHRRSKEAGLYVLQHVPSKYFSPIEWWIQLFGMDGLDILNLGF